MRVLILNQTFHPDVAATGQYVSDLASALAARGHSVTVMCSQRAYDNPGQTYPAREMWREVTVRRIGCTAFGKKARWRRAADFGSYILNCAFQLPFIGSFDVVIGMTSPPLISWLGALFTRFRGGRFVFWVMDLNPDEAIAAGWLRDGSFSTRTLQALLQQSLRGASVVIALDRFMARRLADKGVDPSRIEVVPPWSQDDAVKYDPAGREAFRRKHGLAGKYVVMYSGNHSPCHPLTTLLGAARALREKTDIVFCFVGGGSEQATVRRFAAGHALSNVSVLPYQPLAELSGSLSAADLHVVVMGEPFVGIVHPSKVYNVRALGIPYLYIGPVDSHVTELSPAFAAVHGDVTAVVTHIEIAAAAGGDVAPVAPAEGSFEQSRERLLGRLVTVLERTGGSAVSQPITVGFS